jgi:hypothetical protein
MQEVVDLESSANEDESSDGEEDEAIWAEPSVGPSRAKQASKKAAAGRFTSSTSKQSSNSSKSKPTSGPQPSKKALGKRKATGPEQSSTIRKRSRVEQMSGPTPNTPESEYSASQVSASQAGPGTVSTLKTRGDLTTDVETPTPRARKKNREETIWDYFMDRTINGSKNKTCVCRACGKVVKGRSTSNFHEHQRTKCTKLAEAVRQGIPGIMCEVPATASQTTISATSGTLRQPYSHKTFLAATIKWIIVSGLPFTTIQNPHLQKAFHAANPEAQLQSARTLARKLEDTYDIVSDRIVDHLRSINGTIHYAHDSWTDTGRKHSYFGIYASYVDDNFEYKEILIRLLHMKGKHSGIRMGNGLFELFHNTSGIAARLGPGTGDNASNNRTAADRLAQLLSTELLEEHNGAHLVGCVCHIANIAALRYLSGACECQSSFPIGAKS